MEVYKRVLREARPTMPAEFGGGYCWADVFRMIRASYPWWARPFVRSRCEIAALQITKCLKSSGLYYPQGHSWRSS